MAEPIKDEIYSWHQARDYLLGKLKTIPEIAARLGEGIPDVGAFEIDPTDPMQVGKKDWCGYVKLDKPRKAIQTVGQTVRLEVGVNVGIIVADNNPAVRESKLATAKLRISKLLQTLAHTDSKLGGTCLGINIVGDSGQGKGKDNTIPYAFAFGYILIKLKGVNQ